MAGQPFICTGFVLFHSPFRGDNFDPCHFQVSDLGGYVRSYSPMAHVF